MFSILFYFHPKPAKMTRERLRINYNKTLKLSAVLINFCLRHPWFFRANGLKLCRLPLQQFLRTPITTETGTLILIHPSLCLCLFRLLTHVELMTHESNDN